MKSDFQGGGPKGAKGFPIGDAKHARLAIGGATRPITSVLRMVGDGTSAKLNPPVGRMTAARLSNPYVVISQ